MTGSQTQKFLDAIEAAEIKKYAFDIDDGAKFSHDGERHLIKYNSSDEMLVNICSPTFGGSHSGYGNGGIMIMTAAVEDAHKARVTCDYDQAKTFLENIGTDITDDDLKVMLAIDKKNYNVNPATGDYNRFHYLSEREYEDLSPEEKEKYDAEKAAYEKAQHDYLGKNQAAQITV